jgi:hypothetical protein
MKAILIKVDCQPEIIETNGTLAELSAAVGGYIEIVSLSEDAHAYVNEEGKLLGLPINDAATAIFQRNNGPVDVICGNMIILGSFADDGEYDGEEHDVPARIIVALCQEA